jgi:hypothetical protein
VGEPVKSIAASNAAPINFLMSILLKKKRISTSSYKTLLATLSLGWKLPKPIYAGETLGML